MLVGPPSSCQGQLNDFGITLSCTHLVLVNYVNRIMYFCVNGLFFSLCDYQLHYFPSLDGKLNILSFVSFVQFLPCPVVYTLPLLLLEFVIILKRSMLMGLFVS